MVTSLKFCVFCLETVPHCKATIEPRVSYVSDWGITHLSNQGGPLVLGIIIQMATSQRYSCFFFLSISFLEKLHAQTQSTVISTPFSREGSPNTSISSRWKNLSYNSLAGEFLSTPHQSGNGTVMLNRLVLLQNSYQKNICTPIHIPTTPPDSQPQPVCRLYVDILGFFLKKSVTYGFFFCSYF